MSLAGKGAVAIWHDIAPEGREEFYRWHGAEHMPERVSIDGFLRGRRYAAVDGGAPEYFNLYETESRATLVGADYLARLNNPTPWTIATIKHFRGVSRSLCVVAGSLGSGQAGLIATLRYALAEADVQPHQQEMTDVALPRFAQYPDVAAAHFLIADAQASAIETAEKKVRAEKNLIPRWIVLIEAWGDIAPFKSLCRDIAEDPIFAKASTSPMLNIYRLQNTQSKPTGSAR